MGTAAIHPYATILNVVGYCTTLEQAQTACVYSSSTGPSARRCEAVIYRRDRSPSYGQCFLWATALGQAPADKFSSTYILHEVRQCFTKVNFASLAAEHVEAIGSYQVSEILSRNTVVA